MSVQWCAKTTWDRLQHGGVELSRCRELGGYARHPRLYELRLRPSEMRLRLGKKRLRLGELGLRLRELWSLRWRLRELWLVRCNPGATSAWNVRDRRIESTHEHTH